MKSREEKAHFNMQLLLLLPLVAVLVTGYVIRKDADEVESNRGRQGIIEGDILMTDDQIHAMSAAGKRAKRQITKIWNKWPNAKVYYFFDSAFSEF